MARGLRNMGAIVMAMFVGAALLQSSLAQTTHVVGDSLGWLVPPGGAAAYSTWAANKTFTVGDVLVFNYATGNHDVAKVTKAAFDSCNPSNPISLSTTSPTNITLSSAGEHFFFCTFGQHCTAGQKLGINVSAATAPSPPPAAAPSPPPTTATPSPVPAPTPSPVATLPSSPSPSPVATPSPTPSPVTAPAPGPSSGGQTFVVGDDLGWIVPTGGAAVYQTWAANKTFNVGDTLVFNFMAGAHTVAEVSRTAFNSCDTNAATNAITTSPARITLTAPGEHFFICTVPTHCSRGQLLAIRVTGTAATPSPSGSTTPSPSGSTTPSTPSPSGTVSPPPPEGSAASFTIAALPVTLLSIAMALLY